MSRLIDADILLRNIAEEYDLNYGEILIDPKRFYEMVEDQPTAYNVEKVVAELEEMPNRESDYYYAHSNDVIDREDAIDIVKRGGGGMKEFVKKIINWIKKWKTEPSCNKNCSFCRFSNDCFDYKEGKVDTD